MTTGLSSLKYMCYSLIIKSFISSTFLYVFSMNYLFKFKHNQTLIHSNHFTSATFVSSMLVIPRMYYNFNKRYTVYLLLLSCINVIVLAQSFPSNESFYSYIHPDLKCTFVACNAVLSSI